MTQEDSYKLYAIRICGITHRESIGGEPSAQLNERICDFVLYEVAAEWNEAYENAKPKIQELKELGMKIGLKGLEFIVEDIRDVSVDGWRIKLEKIE